MTESEIACARRDIESTEDLLERAMKLAGVVTSLFRENGFQLVVVGGSAVEFYTEGGYMSGDIDFCRKTLRAIPPRLMGEVAQRLGGKGLGRNWLVCGLYIDILGPLESETTKAEKSLMTPYGEVKVIAPELALVERVLYAEQDVECVGSARQMMASALKDESFDWTEAERLANLRDFKVLDQLKALKQEVTDELARR